MFVTLLFLVFFEKIFPSLLKLTYGNLANAYFALLDDARAIEASDKAIALIESPAQPSDAKYFYRRAVARARQQVSLSGIKDFSGALKDIVKAHKLNPTDSSIVSALGELKAKHTASRKSQANLFSRSLQST